MKNLTPCRVVLLATLSLALLLPGVVLAAPAARPPVDWAALKAGDAVPGELLVGFKPAGRAGLNAAGADTVRAQVHGLVGANVLRRYRTIAVDHVKLSGTPDLAAVARIYERNPEVAYVEPNYIVHALATPNDPRFPELWGMARIRAEPAWDTVTGSAGITVGVIDTGIYRAHEDLAENIWVNPFESGFDSNGVNRATNAKDDDGNGYVDDTYGWDFVNNDNDPTDDNGHGTHCSGTIGGVGNNALGVVGVCWKVKLVGLKFLSAGGSGPIAAALEALEYASNPALGIKLTSNSWGGGGYSQAFRDAIEAAGATANQLFVAAAGNSSDDNDAVPHYPSSYDNSNVIAVASIAVGGALSGFSCYGLTSVDIAAPGSDILSTWNTGASAYNTISGTSMATPHVSGAAALLWSLMPTLSWQQVKAAILDGARLNPNLTGRVLTGGELDLPGALGNLGTGILTLDRLAYRSDATARLRVIDANNVLPSVPVLLQCYSGYTALSNRGTLVSSGTVDLYPVTPTTLTNTAVLASVLTPAPVHGNMLVFTYADPDAGGGPMDVIVTAPVDDVAPVISAVVADPVLDDSATIAWKTDESADSYVTYDTTAPLAPPSWVGSAEFVGWGTGATTFPHAVIASGLAPRTRYLFAVKSADPAGNEAVQPVDLTQVDPSQYPRFSTRFRVNPIRYDMESGPNGWTHSGLSDCWELGEPGYGPTNAYSGTQCWGTRLNGNYDNLMNAWLESPAVPVGDHPRLTFAHWFDMGWGDGGILEVNPGDTGWVRAARYTGGSGGWQVETLDLPASFGNRPLRVRFRLLSDSLGVAAGWYVDDVTISYVAGPGVWVAGIEQPVNDSPGLSAANDGDGYPEVGETVEFGMTVFNVESYAATGVTAVVDCAAPGVRVAAGRNNLGYGNVDVGDIKASSNRIRLAITNNPAVLPASVVLFHSTYAQNGGPWEDQFPLDLSPRVPISGRVTNRLGAAVSGATVVGRTGGYDAVQTTTGGDGAYVLNGLRTGLVYAVHAEMPGVYSRSPDQMVTGPTSNVNFVLGRAYAVPTPTNLALTVAQAGSVSAVLNVANTGVTPDQALEFVPSVTFSAAGLTVGFSSGTGTVAVAPGQSTNLTVTFTCANAAAGTLVGAVRLTGNAVEGETVDVPLTLEILPSPWLELADTLVLDADLDGFAEPGELLDFYALLFNAGALDAFGVTGVVVFAGASGATVPVPDADFGDIAAGEYGFNWFPAQIQVGPGVTNGTPLPFTLEVYDSAGLHWTMPFVITVEVVSAISGQITDAQTLLPLDGIEVTARGADEYLYAAVSSNGGFYAISGLPTGFYTVRVTQAIGYASVPPEVVDATLGDVGGVDFALPPLALSWAPDAFNVTVQEGRETNGTLSVTNNSITNVEITMRPAMVEGTIAASSVAQPAQPYVNWDALSDETADPSALIVRFRAGASAQAMATACEVAGCRILANASLLPLALVQVPSGGSLRDSAALLQAQAAVLYVEPNYRNRILESSPPPRLLPRDPYLQRLPGMDDTGQWPGYGTVDADIDAPEAWNVLQGDPQVIVAVIDTGIDYTHEDLAANMWSNVNEIVNGIDDDGNGYIDDIYGFNFLFMVPGWSNVYYTNGDPMDDHSHGSHVSGTIGGVGNNDLGVVGVNWKCRLMALKAFDFFGSGNVFSETLALDYAIRMGAKIVNNSWGGSQFGQAFHDMSVVAMASNVLLVCAAGNDGVDTDAVPNWPSCDPLENIVAVAATDWNDLLAGFSNFGHTTVDLAAPGVDILSCVPGSFYDYMSGTSMATPHTAGVAALLKAYAPDAPWYMIKQALLQGVVPDPRLADKTVTGGHLNAYLALRNLGGLWLGLDPTRAVLAALGGNTNVNVTFNQGGDLPAGSYEGRIVIESGSVNTFSVPVSLTVVPGPVPRYASVRVDDTVAGDGDGVAEPGETVTLQVTLQNRGSMILNASTGTLTTAEAGVTVLSPALAWPQIPSASLRESVLGATVALGGGVGSNLLFRLAVAETGGSVWSNLWFELDVGARFAITGRVTNASGGAGVAGALVEYAGGAAGTTVAGADGFYRISGLGSGTYTLQARAAGLANSVWTNVTVAGADARQDFVLGAPAVRLMPSNVVFEILSDESANAVVAATNTGTAAWRGRGYELPRRSVALLSDGAQLSALRPVIEAWGLDCTVIEQNALYYYSADAGILSLFDVVIADLTGEDGFGRVVYDVEVAAMQDFVSRGGKLLLTGASLLGAPDNLSLAGFVGSRTTGIRGASPALETWTVLGDHPITAGPYLPLAAGARVATTPGAYDNARVDTNLSATALLSGSTYAKVIHRSIGGGDLVYWNGNRSASDWLTAGALRDLFKNVLFNFVQADVPWLTQSGTAPLAVAAAGGATFPVGAVGLGLPELSTNRAVVLLAGSPDVALPVTLVIARPTVRVQSTTGVVRWDGTALPGNGSVTSCLFQVLWAGPNGTNDPADLHGNPTGDDVLLASYPAGEAFGRFGAGYEMQPDFGKFSALFRHALPSGAVVFVRAWDGASFDAAVAYGDSARRTLSRRTGEAQDFGTWTVGTAPGYPGASLGGVGDQNGDSIPDGYAILAGLDPRDPIVALVPQIASATTVGALGSGVGKFNKPSRIVATTNFVYVADTENHRVTIWDRALSGQVGSFGSNGTGTNQFRGPQGLAIDPVNNRLVVADTLNNRVVVLNQNPTTGALSYRSHFGTAGSLPGELNSPFAIGIGPGGRIHVADSLDVGSIHNDRVQMFTSAGAFEGAFGQNGTLNGRFQRVLGVAVSASGLIFAADSDNNRLQGFAGSGAYLWKYGTLGTATGQFDGVHDVQVGPLGRLYTMDRDNHRVQIVDASAAPGTIRTLGAYGQLGSLSGEFRFPRGVFAIGEDVYVADTLNHRIQRLRLLTDADGDGMDDVWEGLNGLNPADPSDANQDPDGDGLLNIGEYRLRTNPHDADSNDNGASDGWDVLHGLSPSAAGSPVSPPRATIGSNAGGTPKLLGQVVRVTATFSEAVAAAPVPLLSLSGGASLSGAAMALLGGSVYYYDYTVDADDGGAVNAAVSGALDLQGYSLDPDPTGTNALFMIQPVEFAVTDLEWSPFRVSWEAVLNGIYCVQSAPDLSGSNWVDGVTVTSAVSGVDIWTGSAPTNGLRFYRVKRIIP